ncbi:MAG: hypothetical protein PQJ60_07365 [Spirochaetales bacterium]|nr:hypothetical protein [Spirochaetales bacterium]
MDNIEKQIISGTEQGGKSYEFNNDHNPQVPAQWWFQNPPEGLTLFVVFYTQACRWAKCTGCNLPSQMSQTHVGYKDLFKQVDYIFHNLLNDDQKVNLKKIIISNNGSILDEKTFSTTALFYFIGKMNYHCPNISTLTMETRPEYVEFEELTLLSRALEEGDTPTILELAIGFEAYDSSVRNDQFLKGLELSKFEGFAKNAGKFGFHLKCYFMLKPVPGLSEQDAEEDIRKAITYLGEVSEKHNVTINMHLNPTYVAKGTPLEESFLAGDYEPPRLPSLVNIIRHAKDHSLSLFVGLDDEGLAVQGGSFIREGDEKLITKLEEFNRTQNYNLFT